MSGLSGLLSLDSPRDFSAAAWKGVNNSLRHRGSYQATFSIQARQINPEKGTEGIHTSGLFGINTATQGQHYWQSKDLLVLLDGYLANRTALQVELKLSKEVSTAELIARAYQTWGAQCSDHFDGAWAILLWDAKQQKLFASRDRIGVKPFYYYHQNGIFAFASEQKALLQFSEIEARMNPASVFDFFFLQEIESKTGLFQGISELPASHQLSIDLNHKKLQLHRYYNLAFTTALPTYRKSVFQKYQQQVRETVLETVQNRLAHHQPASLLSGGLDSSVLVAALKELSGEDPLAFTSSFVDPLIDESDWAKQVAEHTGSQWHQVYPKLEDLREDLETLAYAQDIPLTSAGTYSQFRVMRLAAERGASHVFDGQGADALFAGHVPHQVMLWRDFLKKVRLGKFRAELSHFSGNGWSMLLRMTFKYRYLSGLPTSIRHRFNLRYFKELTYFKTDFIEAHRDRYALYQGGSAKSANEFLHQAYFGGGLRFLLKCVDRSAAWQGIEAITPYADSRSLMELLFQIPANYKIRQGRGKELLREAFRYSLPQKVVDRRDKKALATPNNQWMMELRDVIYPYFEQMPDDVFDRKRLLKDFQQFFTIESPHENYRLFKYLGFALWRKVFEV